MLKVQRWESLAVGYDAGKHVKGRKRFVTVDTLGLVLRVLVTAASVGEREGGKQVLKQVKQMGIAMSRVHTIWVDGGFDGDPFMRARYGYLPLDQSKWCYDRRSASALSYCPSVGWWSAPLAGSTGVGV